MIQQRANRKHDLYLFSCIGFCGLYFLRDIVGIGISYHLIYLIAAVAIWVCTKEESIAFVLAMLTFQNAGYNGEFSIIILTVIVLKFNKMIRYMKLPFILLVLMGIYETLHYFFPGGASISEYITYTSLLIVLGIMCQYPHDRIDKILILKSYFFFSLFFVLIILLQVLRQYGSFEALIEVGFRGKKYAEIVEQGTNLIANQNYLTVICSVNLGIGAMLIAIGKEKVRYIIGLGSFIIVGLLTISKMFMVILVCYALYLIIVAYRRKVRYGISITFLIITISILIVYIFGDNLLALITGRFEQGDLATGRIDIVRHLLMYMNTHKYMYIWGAGILNLTYTLGVAVHSSFFEVIGGWGYVGILFPVLFIISMIKSVKKASNYRKIRIGLNVLPLLIMLLYSLSGMLFSSPGAIARLIVCIYAVGITGEKNEI